VDYYVLKAVFFRIVFEIFSVLQKFAKTLTNP